MDHADQVAVQIAGNQVGGIIAGLQDLIVGSHMIIIVCFARTVTGDAVAFDQWGNMHLVGWHLAFCQNGDRAGLSGILGHFGAVIPGVAHKGDDIFDIARA